MSRSIKAGLINDRLEEDRFREARNFRIFSSRKTVPGIVDRWPSFEIETHSGPNSVPKNREYPKSEIEFLRRLQRRSVYFKKF